MAGKKGAVYKKPYICRCATEPRVLGMCRNCYARHLKRNGAMPKPTVEQRFWARVNKTEGCWFWERPTNRGYGLIGVGYKSVLAHRFSYELHKGPIPEGMDIDHMCHNEDPDCLGGETCPHRACVNPDHLVPASRKENSLRGKAPTVVWWRTDTCKRGHSLADAYVAKLPDGRTRRNCRTCIRDKWAAKAADPEFRRKRAAYELARKRKQREQVA